MRNRQFIGYTLRALERNVKGRLFDFEGGGGCQNLFRQIIYFRHELGREIYFHVAWAQNLFRVNMVNHSPLRQLITRNSNVIESSSMRWNY